MNLNSVIPQDLSITATPTFVSTKLTGLADATDFGVYHTADGTLTKTAPATGVLGYWSKTTTVLSPSPVITLLNVTGAITASGQGTFGSTEIGSWPASATFAYFINSALTAVGATEYALIQSNAGETYINCASDKQIHFRSGNADRMTLSNAGLLRIDHTGGSVFQVGSSQVSLENDLTAIVKTITYTSTPGNSSQQVFTKTRGTRAAQTVVADDDRVGSFTFQGHDGTDSNTSGAAFLVNVDGAVASNSVPMEFSFEVMKPTETSRTVAMRIASSTDVIIPGDMMVGSLLAPSYTLEVAGTLGVTGVTTLGDTLVGDKFKLTLIGGYAIKLTNKTGSNTIAGQLVKADTATNDAVILTAAGDVECFGVFLDAGIADGAEAWVVVSGIADVAMEDNTAATRGNWVSTSGTEAGYADATSATPAAAPAHFEEIGHCIESVAAGGAGTHILARCVLHFN